MVCKLMPFFFFFFLIFFENLGGVGLHRADFMFFGTVKRLGDDAYTRALVDLVLFKIKTLNLSRILGCLAKSCHTSVSLRKT